MQGATVPCKGPAWLAVPHLRGAPDVRLRLHCEGLGFRSEALVLGVSVERQFAFCSLSGSETLPEISTYGVRNSDRDQAYAKRSQHVVCHHKRPFSSKRHSHYQPSSSKQQCHRTCLRAFPEIKSPIASLCDLPHDPFGIFSKVESMWGCSDHG